MKRKLEILLLLIAICLGATEAQAGKKNVLRGAYGYPILNERSVRITVSAGKIPKKTPLEFYRENTKLDNHDVQQLDDSTYQVLVRSMRKWSLNAPASYTITVKVGEETADVHVGFREVNHHNGFIDLNDTTFLLKGLSHKALPESAYKTEAQWRTLFMALRKEDFNFISLPAERLNHDVLCAADKSGIIIHTMLTEERSETQDVSKKKDKKKDKKKSSVLLNDSYASAIMRQFGSHPSLCLVSYAPGTPYVQNYNVQETCICQPDTEDTNVYISDYASKIDTTTVCMADLSNITEERMATTLERTLCTEGMGALLFGSLEQSKHYEGIQMLGQFSKDSWDTSEAMQAKIIISNNTDQTIMGKEVKWELVDETGFPLSYGHFRGNKAFPRHIAPIGMIFSPLGGVFPGSLVSMKVYVEGTDISRTWTTRVQYPKRIRYLNEKLTERMKEWCKRLPGETDEEYRLRVNDVTKNKQRKLFATQICTEMAGDLMAGCEIKLGRYDEKDELLNMNLSNLPPVRLRVPRDRKEAFAKEGELEFRDVQYGLQKKDEFEIVHAVVFNKVTDEHYVYDNMDTDAMERLLNDPRYVPTELMELADKNTKALQTLKEVVIEAARKTGMISDHTHINVSNFITTDFNDKGELIKNYKVNFIYDVDTDYSAQEDFAPGRYRVEQSHAAVSLAEIIKRAFENELKPYLKAGKRLDVSITGSADASPIRSRIAYDGAYGDFCEEPYYLKEELSKMTVTQAGGITENAQLAYIRAQGLGSLLDGKLPNTKDMDVRYLYNIELPKGTGGKYRRIKVSVTFVDTF